MFNRFTAQLLFTFFVTFAFQTSSARAVSLSDIEQNTGSIAHALLTPHKALYDIHLVATRSGSQIINISGQMMYEWQPTCDAWVTDHQFNLFYEYADSPGMNVSSDFSTYEGFQGDDFNFYARRRRDNVMYEELRGHAAVNKGASLATFNLPEGLEFDLKEKTLFPMAHTAQMVQKALNGQKFYTATVFDGSDDKGPVEINSFIGAPVNPLKNIIPSEALDMALLNNKAWNVRMAVFPLQDENAQSDYEMNVIFHENGVISDMLIDYDDFSVSQKLIALERVRPKRGAQFCDAKPLFPLKKADKK